MTTWFSSDPHLGHRNIVEVFKHNGQPARPFKNISDHNEVIVARHNERVMRTHRWYCLGDLAMSDGPIEQYLPRMAGEKFLILGNHDLERTAFYLQFFKDVLSMTVMADMLFTHIPIAPWSFGSKIRANIHGHCHLATPVTYKVANPLGDAGWSRKQVYVNLSMERTNYAPVTLEQIERLVKHA